VHNCQAFFFTGGWRWWDKIRHLVAARVNYRCMAIDVATETCILHTSTVFRAKPAVLFALLTGGWRWSELRKQLGLIERNVSGIGWQMPNGALWLVRKRGASGSRAHLAAKFLPFGELHFRCGGEW